MKGELDPATKLHSHFDILAGDKGVEFLATDSLGNACEKL
jgi:hypothetical protein